MRAAVSILLLISSAQAAIVSREWRDGKLTLKLDDGTAEMEWISSTSFRFARKWAGADDPILRPVIHEKIAPALEDSGKTIVIKTKYVTAELDRDDLSLRLRSGETPIASIAIASGVQLRLGLAADERIYGLRTGRLNVRGETVEQEHGFFTSSKGYGMYVRSPERCAFDMAQGTIRAAGAKEIEYAFYYGPAPKEILEQHLLVTGDTEITALNVLPANRVPKEATPIPSRAIDSWDAFRQLILTLNQYSLSAVLYPAVDVLSFESAPAEVKQRAMDLSALLPLLYRTAGDTTVDREKWKPYLMTYLREAHDRGIPLIRPLPMQFSKDPKADQQTDLFMLGDELLLAPVLSPGNKRKLELPRGLWTDFWTNAEYKGAQSIEVDAPQGRVPTFVRNGWIVPIALADRLELHYYPSLGAEFFLWEPSEQDNSQFHAAPAGDYTRVEVESKVARTYEWILHHTPAPRTVGEDSGAYQRVADRAELRAGAWWHDDAQNNLHFMMRSVAGTDRIVNVR